MALRFLTIEDVLALHADLLDRDGGTPGILNLGGVDSALYRCKWGPYFGEPPLARRAALLCRGLCQDHPFADGNKRTAYAAALTFLALNGVALDVPEGEEVAFVVAVAQDQLDLDATEAWFQSHLDKVQEGGR